MFVCALGRMVTSHRQIMVTHQVGILRIKVQLGQQGVRILGRVFVQRRYGVRLSSHQPTYRHTRIADNDQGESTQFLLPSGLYVVTRFKCRTSLDHRNRKFTKS